MEEKNGFDITKLYCGAVVKELLERANPGHAVFCFFESFFFCLQPLFFNAIFPFGMFSFILTQLLLTLLIMHLDRYIL